MRLDKENKDKDLEVVLLTQLRNWYDLSVKPTYQPKIIADMPLLSRLADKVPKGFYRLGLIQVAPEGLETPTKIKYFVSFPYNPPKYGLSYIAAIDEERKLYWNLAQVVPRIGLGAERFQQLIHQVKPRDLAQLLKKI